MKPTIHVNLASSRSAEKNVRRPKLSHSTTAHGLLASALVSSLVCWAGAAPAQQVSYRTDVRPILDTRCVSCHACFDAPDQLDLRSRMGVERGASKTDPYAPRGNYVPMTFISQTPQTVEQWRDLGFYSVIDGGKQSVMARILNLGHGNPLQANAKLPSELDGRLDSLERKNVAPNAIEFDAYAIQHPHEGMPFAVSGLDDKAYTTLMTWLDQGAKFDDVKIQPSALEQKTIAEWEVLPQRSRRPFEARRTLYFRALRRSPRFLLFQFRHAALLRAGQINDPSRPGGCPY